MLTRNEAFELASRIRRDANTPVRTVLGRTNGLWLVHVIEKETRRSVNIADEGEWIVHPLNKRNRPARVRRARRDRDILADDQTVEKGLNTIYTPED